MKLKHLLTHTGKNSFAIAIAELQNAQTVLRWLLQLCNSLKQFCDGYCSLAKTPNSFAMVIAALQKPQTVLRWLLQTCKKLKHFYFCILQFLTSALLRLNKKQKNIVALTIIRQQTTNKRLLTDNFMYKPCFLTTVNQYVMGFLHSVGIITITTIEYIYTFVSKCGETPTRHIDTIIEN